MEDIDHDITSAWGLVRWLHNHGMDLDQDPQKYMEDHHIKSAWKLEILL